jgi:hypothetical protein
MTLAEYPILASFARSWRMAGRADSTIDGAATRNGPCRPR